MISTSSVSKSLRIDDTVLVTGVTGFIGAHVADQLLKAGYRVRGTARRGSNKIDHLRNLFKSYGDRFEVAEVGDLSEEGAFDEVVKDVDAICHVASPVTMQVADPFRDLVQPAVNGTLSVLTAAKRFGNKVRHVVVTSSVASVIHPIDDAKEYTYTESDWNDNAIALFKDWKSGDNINGLLAYFASKNEAERALWKFVDEEKPSFGVSTMLPAFTFGPVIQAVSRPEEINASSTLVFHYFAGIKKEIDPPSFMPFVNVQDVALAHVRALERTEVSSGQRFILSAGNYTGQQVVDILRKRFPEQQGVIPEGRPGTDYPSDAVTLSNKKAVESLGIQFRDLEESVVATCETLKRFA